MFHVNQICANVLNVVSAYMRKSMFLE